MVNQDQQPHTQLFCQNDAQHLGPRCQQPMRIVRRYVGGLPPGPSNLPGTRSLSTSKGWPNRDPMLADPVRNASAPKLASHGRFVQSEEVGGLGGFLLGPSRCSITGQRLVICGGASP